MFLISSQLIIDQAIFKDFFFLYEDPQEIHLCLHSPIH